MPQTLVARIAAQLGLRREQVDATIGLLDAGNTVPFVARYRKEVTGLLDEEQLRQLNDLLAKLRALDARRESIISTVKSQGKLTPELRQRFLKADTLTDLEDLYQPYRPKRRTRASIARDRGLQGLADRIVQQPIGGSAVHLARPFLSDQVPTVEEALAGARDIVAEEISDRAEVRGRTREKALAWGRLHSERTDGSEDPRGVYELYYSFEHPVERLRPHQILALNRGEAEGVLRLRVEVAERDWRESISLALRPDGRSCLADHLAAAIEDAAARLLLPAVERDVRRAMTERAEAHAISVFAANVRALLGQPPLSGRTVVGIDPGFRTGCKVAVVDPTGKLLDTATIYPHPPQEAWDAALQALGELVARNSATLIAVGNGTASRETEQLAAQLIRERRVRDPLHYLIVSEAGASVYSASPLARAELPELDVSMRGAVSIARRVQDPLAELVKISPQSLGVGMYQHDVNQSRLDDALEAVVESVVNSVGVDVNSASPALLAYVAGVGPKLAERIVDYRDDHGPFPSRRALLEVPGLGPRSFEQAAGFLRVRHGDMPLDNTAIHPESYRIAEAVMARAGSEPEADLETRREALARLRAHSTLVELAATLGTGVPTLADIFEQLARPGRDPREDLPAPLLRSDVLTMDDLEVGMRLRGTVRNVVDFGAFVDIGIKHDGLLHRSQIPRDATPQAGDVVEVEILKVEPERGRVALGWVAA